MDSKNYLKIMKKTLSLFLALLGLLSFNLFGENLKVVAAYG